MATSPRSQEDILSQGEDARARKRPRKIWSCLECRRKKLQCDHGFPACGRCVRSGKQASCKYTSDLPATFRIPAAPNDNATKPRESESPHYDLLDQTLSKQQPLKQPHGNSNNDLVSRLATLETKVRSFEETRTGAGAWVNRNAHGSGGSQVPSPDDTELATLEPHASVLHGAGFRTKYNGNTCVASLAEHIPGLTSFTGDAFATFPAFDQIQAYLNRSEERNVLTSLKPSLSPDENLRTLLPPRAEADRLVRIYLDAFDAIYPVMHIPTFQQTYETVWTQRGTTQHTEQLLLVLLMIAIAQCLTSTPSSLSEGQTQTLRSKATLILDGCDHWLRTRVVRYDYLIECQIGFLMLLGRQLNGRRSKRTWVNAGNMLRTLMCQGMHRDPERMGRETTALDKEMRRRIWASTAEFELQAAFEHGMPAVSWTSQSDIASPANLDDVEISEFQPHRVQRARCTKASFISQAGESLHLRHQLNCTLNDMRHVMPYSKAITHTNTLKQHLQTIAADKDSFSGPARALLEITIHQYILALHAQQLHHATLSIERSHSRLLLLESSLSILEAHKSAASSLPRNHSHHAPSSSSSSSSSSTIELLMGTHPRAALSISYAHCTADPTTDRILATTLEQNGRAALEDLIALYSEKILRFGGSKLNLWLTCAADGLMKLRSDARNRDSYLQEAVDHFTRPFYRLMALPRQEASVNGGVGNVGLGGGGGGGGGGVLTDAASVDVRGGQQGAPVPTMTDMSMPALNELAEWTLDDFSFNQFDFLDPSRMF